MNFYERCEMLAKDKGLSMKELGEKVGVSGAAITGWKNGSQPKLDVALKVAQVLNVSLDFLATGVINQENTFSPESIQIAALYTQLPKNLQLTVSEFFEIYKKHNEYKR